MPTFETQAWIDQIGEAIGRDARFRSPDTYGLYLNLIAALQGHASSPAGLTSLAAGSLSGSAINITDIPDTFPVLRLSVRGLSSDTATRRPSFQPSFDNGSSYDTTAGNYEGIVLNGSLGTLADASLASFASNANITAAQTIDTEIWVSGYQSGHYTMYMGMSEDSTPARRLVIGFHRNANAIDALRIFHEGSGAFDAGVYQLSGCR